MAELPIPHHLIRTKLAEGKVIPFLGSGASLPAPPPQEPDGDSDAPGWKPNDGTLPTAGQLAQHFAEMTGFPEDEQLELAKVAQYYGLLAGRAALCGELHGIFAQRYPVPELHRYLAELETPLLIVTTNYDDLIERAFDERGRHYDKVVYTADLAYGDYLLWWTYGEAEPRKVVPNKVPINLSERSVIFKMHGTVDPRPELDQYVITEDDYVEFLARDAKLKAIPLIFGEPFKTRHFLFLGYSLSDWNLRVVLSRAVKELDVRKKQGKEEKTPSWAVRIGVRPLERRLWQQRGVETYDLSIDEFVRKLRGN